MHNQLPTIKSSAPQAYVHDMIGYFYETDQNFCLWQLTVVVCKA